MPTDTSLTCMYCTYEMDCLSGQKRLPISATILNVSFFQFFDGGRETGGRGGGDVLMFSTQQLVDI